MKVIPLPSGEKVFVDDEDYGFVSRFKWRMSGKYAATTSGIHYNDSSKRNTVYMHRLVLLAPASLQVDHIDGNKLNNKKSNLRVCTATQNRGNTPYQTNNTSGFKGVTYDKARRQWKAQISYKKVAKGLGRFNKKEDAARAYNQAAKKYYGIFAWLNPL